jgi:FkbH-like protein
MSDQGLRERGVLDAKAARLKTQALWRKYLANAPKCEKRTADVTVAIAASFTADTLVPLLGGELVQAGLSPKIVLGAYNQLFQACFSPVGAFGATPDAILLIWRMEELLEEPFRRFVLEGEARAMHDAEQQLAALADAVSALRKNFAGSILVTLPLPPRTPYFETVDVGAAQHGSLFYRRLLLTWMQHLQRIGGVHVIDLDAIVHRIGQTAAYDPRKWYLYRQPLSDLFLHELAQQIRRVLVAERQPSAKCVVLDCDNTLWGGIIGEDGISGIQIGQDFPGSAYRDFHLFLLGLRHRGILLTLCTKNNEEDVKDVFQSHDGMLLRWSDVSAYRIGWRPKWETISEIAAELNIATDSLVFIDDNAFEIEQMRRAHPEIRCIQLPEDPALLLNEVRSHHYFDKLEVTEEDRARADMMQAERTRAVGASAMSGEDFLQSLGLVLNFVTARPEHLGRVAQLINKTNQFNLTTKRRTLDDVRALHHSTDHRIFAIDVEDRFGKYGLVGVVIVGVANPEIWEIDTFLLSCRVLGRGVEAAIIGLVASAARAAQVPTLRGFFVPTAKNAVASQFFAEMGFIRTDETSWESATAAVREPAPYLHVRTD